MKYKFIDHESTDRSGRRKVKPAICIDDHEKYGALAQDELNNLSFDYLKEIVSSLEKVKSGELGQYDFGFEVYSFNCSREICRVEDTFEGDELLATIPFQDIYQMLSEWVAYLKAWRTQQGLPGEGSA